MEPLAMVAAVGGGVKLLAEAVPAIRELRQPDDLAAYLPFDYTIETRGLPPDLTFEEFRDIFVVHEKPPTTAEADMGQSTILDAPARTLMREAVRQAAAEPMALIREDLARREAYADIGYHTAGYPAVVLRGAYSELIAPMETGEMREFGGRLIRTADSLDAGGGIPEE